MNPEIALLFHGSQQVRRIRPLGNGHINETFLVEYHDGPDRVLQRLNTHVFPRPDWVMDNILRVTEHIRAKLDGQPDCERRCLKVVPTRDGRMLHQGAQTGCWRMYERVQPVQSFDRLVTPQQAYFVGRSFGEFQALLADLPSPRLHETISDFHHTPKRLARLQHVARIDPLGRRAAAQLEIDFVEHRRERVRHLVDRYERGELPERITHNDTKLNNLLFDEAGLEPLCVVDLDTVMPGLIHYDFGDMVRTGCATAAEDETDLSLVDFDRTIFEGLVRGYLEAGRSFLTRAEVEELAFAGILLTLEVGIRFLTDYLEGDVYFKVHHPEHNLERCRCQFELVRRLEAAESDLHTMVMQLWETQSACLSA